MTFSSALYSCKFVCLSLYLLISTGKMSFTVSCFVCFSEFLLTFQVNASIKEKSLAIHDEADVAQCKVSLST